MDAKFADEHAGSLFTALCYEWLVFINHSFSLQRTVIVVHIIVPILQIKKKFAEFLNMFEVNTAFFETCGCVCTIRGR
jgi:hypothetical protein